MVYHGPKAMEELVRFDPSLVVGILGGSAGTTRDAFQLLHDAQKYGARVALFGRKINYAENQLAFVHFLRLIVEGQVGPIDAVKAYHAVLGRLGLRPNRSHRGRSQADRPVDELRGDLEVGRDRCGRQQSVEARSAAGQQWGCEGSLGSRSEILPDLCMPFAAGRERPVGGSMWMFEWSCARHGVVLGLAVQSYYV